MSTPSAPTRAAGSSQPPSAANGPDSSRCQLGSIALVCAFSSCPLSAAATIIGDGGPASVAQFPVSRPSPLYSNTCAYTESLALPSTYGRSCDGTSETAVIHDSEITTVTSPASATWAHRVRSRAAGAASRYAAASAGSASQAWIIFVWKARPTQTPAISSIRSDPLSSAADVASAASTSSRISSESDTLPRPSSTVTGVTATTAAAVRPAAGPASRRTARYSTRTVSTPSTTCGRTSAQI